MRIRTTVLLVGGCAAVILAGLYQGSLSNRGTEELSLTVPGMPVSEASVSNHGVAGVVACDLDGCCTADATVAVITNEFQSDEERWAAFEVDPEHLPLSEEAEVAPGSNPEKDELLRALTRMAASNPERTLEEVLRMPEGEERMEALEAVCFGVAETDPAAAVSVAMKVGLDQRPGTVLENLVSQWADADLAAASDWVHQQPAGPAKDQMFVRVAFTQSRGAPAEAARLIEDQIPAGPTRVEAVMMVLHQWANQDLIAAASWAAGFPSGPLRERAISELENIAEYQQASTRSW